LTPDLRVCRLIPNHFLDLTTFQCVRYWPAPATSAVFGSVREPAGVVSALATRLRENVEILARSGPLHLSLTAGRDSRMVLAASRRFMSQIECYTFRLAGAQLDLRIARVIARRFRFRHYAVAWVEPSAQDQQEWQERTGRCVGGSAWHLASTLKQLQGSAIRTSGLCGEVGRSYYWRVADLERRSLSPEEVVSRLHLPATTRLHAQAEAWLVKLPLNEVPHVLDLLYMEQRLGCWAGPKQYGQPGIRSVPPLCDRRLFELMLSLPCEYRFAQRLAPDLIAHLWPELLRVPFNRDTGLRRVLGDLTKTVRRGLRSAHVPGRRAH